MCGKEKAQINMSNGRSWELRGFSHLELSASARRTDASAPLPEGDDAANVLAKPAKQRQRESYRPHQDAEGGAAEGARARGGRARGQDHGACRRPSPTAETQQCVARGP